MSYNLRLPSLRSAAPKRVTVFARDVSRWSRLLTTRLQFVSHQPTIDQFIMRILRLFLV